MPLLRYDEMVPEVYVNQSRDFQTLSRLFTLGLSSSKYYADKLHYQNSANYVDDSLLPLLQRKVGFYTNYNFRADELRSVINIFYSLVKNKGSLSSVEQAIRLFFQTQNLNTTAYIEVDNENYVIKLGVDSSIRDITLLTEILKYIIPTGYLITVFFYEHQSFEMYVTTHDDLIMITAMGDDRSSIGTLADTIPVNGVDTTTIYNQHDNGEQHE